MIDMFSDIFVSTDSKPIWLTVKMFSGKFISVPLHDHEAMDLSRKLVAAVEGKADGRTLKVEDMPDWMRSPS